MLFIKLKIGMTFKSILLTELEMFYQELIRI